MKMPAHYGYSRVNNVSDFVCNLIERCAPSSETDHIDAVLARVRLMLYDMTPDYAARMGEVVLEGQAWSASNASIPNKEKAMQMLARKTVSNLVCCTSIHKQSHRHRFKDSGLYEKRLTALLDYKPGTHFFMRLGDTYKIRECDELLVEWVFNYSWEASDLGMFADTTKR